MPPSHQLVILLAEDDADSREMYCHYLKSVGCRIEQARDGKEALEIARRIVPDVLVTDLKLPGMDGLQLSAELRRDARTAKMPIIAVTGITTPDIEQRMARVGITASLLKPCLPDDLFTEIRRLTRKQ